MQQKETSPYFDPGWLRQQRDAGQVFDRGQVIALLAAYERAQAELADYRHLNSVMADGLEELAAAFRDASDEIERTSPQP